jgi:hypothetical protein
MHFYSPIRFSDAQNDAANEAQHAPWITAALEDQIADNLVEEMIERDGDD